MATYAPIYSGPVSSDTTFGTVTGWFNALNQYATFALSSAGQAISNINKIDPIIFDTNIVYQAVTGDVTLDNGNKPTPVVFTPTSSSTPSGPSISLSQIKLKDVATLFDVSPTTLSLLDNPDSPELSFPTVTLDSLPVDSSITINPIVFKEAPEFNIADPSINIPDVPSPLAVSLPTRDFSITTDFTYPDAPTSEVIPVPTLIDLNLPTAETLNLPTFSLDFPSSSSLIVPGITFGFNEQLYSSDLLTKVSSTLLERLSEHTGLPPNVEEAIWNRGRDREQRSSLLSERSLLVDRTSQGFTRPSGATQAALNQIVQETQSKLIELSREIMIKQSELSQENIKTSIQQVIALEDILIRNHSQVVQRAFEVAKYIQDTQIEIFKIEVSKYNTEVEAYKAFVEAYNARVRAELSKIEIFKAQLDAERTKNEINVQNIQLYTAKIEAVKSNVEIYRALTSAIVDKLQAEQLKIATYKTDIEAYGQAVSAKALEYQSYAEQLKGEETKVNVFDSKVKAYANKIQAYSVVNDSLIKKAGIENDLQTLLLKQYDSKLNAINSLNDYRLRKGSLDLNAQELLLKEYDSKIGAISNTNDTRIKKGSLDNSNQELLLKSYEAKTNSDIAYNESLIKKATLDTNIQELVLKGYEAQLEAYIKDRQAEQLAFQSAVDVYKSQASIYIAEQDVNKSKAEIKLKLLEDQIQQNKYSADIAIEQARLALEQAKANSQLALEGAKSSGSIYQAIASSALSSINVAAQIQAQNSVSYNENLSLSG